MLAPVLLTFLLQAPAAVSNGPRSIPAVLKDLPHAFARLPRLTNLAILAGSGAAAAAVHRDDRDLTDDAAGSRTVDRLTEGGSLVGAGYVQVGAAFATWLAGAATAHPGAEALGGDLLEAQAMNGLLTSAMKYSVERKRPDGGRHSFPSGHTSATFATAAVLDAHYGLKAGLPAYALGAYVAGARLHDRKHFASDTLVGAGIGLVSGRAVRPWRRAHLTTAVVPLDRGVAIVGTVARP